MLIVPDCAIGFHSGSERKFSRKSERSVAKL